MLDRLRRLFSSSHARVRIIISALAVGALLLVAVYRALHSSLVPRLTNPLRRLVPSTGTRWRIAGGVALAVGVLLAGAAAYGVLRTSLDPQLKRWLLTRAAAVLVMGGIGAALLWRVARRGRRARRMVQYGLLSSPVVMIATAIAVILLVQRTSLSPTSQAAPAQPIDFNHVVHAKMLGLSCTFCHRTATTEASAGMPALAQCMFCHQVVNTPNPGIQKLVTAAQNGQPIDWARVYQLPDHVIFVHEAHLSAGFTCADCHGAVADMAQVRQARDLRMGDCVACHTQNNAPTQCSTCHK